MSIRPEDKLRKATIHLLRTDPFFASVVLCHNLEEKPGDGFEIDGRTIRYGTDFVKDRTVTELEYVLRHNVMHVVLGHHLRHEGYVNYEMMQEGEAEAKVLKRLNIAGDLAVNSLIVGSPGRPSECIVPGAGKYQEMPKDEAMEQYYNLLKQREDQDENDEDGDSASESPDNGDDASGSGTAQEGSEEHDSASDSPQNYGGTGSFAQAPANEQTVNNQEEWRQMITQAEVAAEKAGKLPGWVKEMVSGKLEPAAIPWERVLRRFLTRSIRNHHSYRRLSRRHGYRHDMIMPGRQGKGLGKIVFGVDTSGSMSKAVLDKALAEIQAIAALHKEGEIVVIQWDTRVADETSYTRKDFPIDTSKWEWCGRGDTRIASFIKACNKINPQVVICCTDGLFHWPEERIQVPTLWIKTRDFMPPWGEGILAINS